MANDKPVVFVSCGQFSSEEKQLGTDICGLIHDLRPDCEPYFAEYQSTLEGLSDNVLRALHSSAAFICVMHPRGELQRPDSKSLTRGSVWVEQEIAIAAFMNRVLGRSLPIYFYKHQSVGLEGVRSVLLLNPRLEFLNECEVLDDVRILLRDMHVDPYRFYDLKFTPEYKVVHESQEKHIYRLVIDIQNVGKTRVTDFELRVTFPQVFLHDVSARTADRFRVLRYNAKDWARDGIYPGDKLRRPIEFEYFVDEPLDSSPHIESEFTIELVSGDMEVKKSTYKISEFSNF